MTDSVSDRSFVPEGWHTITPRIVVQGAEQLVEFLARVFSATGEFQETRPSVVKIGDSVVMISEAGIRSPMPTFLYVYVGNSDAVPPPQGGPPPPPPPFFNPPLDSCSLVGPDRGGSVKPAPHPHGPKAPRPSMDLETTHWCPVKG